MIIKTADDKSTTIHELETYLADSRIPDDVKRKIEKERNNVWGGAANERQSAYFIDFRYGATPNWMVLHDLRIEEAGRTAQIDHLFIWCPAPLITHSYAAEIATHFRQCNTSVAMCHRPIRRTPPRVKRICRLQSAACQSGE